MNNYKRRIEEIINSADRDIKLAVSWFTDVDIINAIIVKARAGVKIQILLSADDYNLVRYNDFKLLESLGAEIRKRGSANALDGDFMHAKVLIIDDSATFGGSYNYTRNAISNYEVFGEFKNPSVHIHNFNAQFGTAVPLLAGLTEEIANLLLKELAKQHRNITSKSVVLSTSSESKNLSLSEHFSLMDRRKDRIYELNDQAKKLQSGKARVDAAGDISHQCIGLPVKPHTYHGGGMMMGYRPERRNKFAALCFQKYLIDKHYTVFKTKIHKGHLTCKGAIDFDDQRYEINIIFNPGMPPKVTLPKLEAEPKFDIHMYDDGSLCLYYPAEQKWTDYTKIAAYTIPWVVEWICLYELWKLTGKWEAKESPIHDLRLSRNSPAEPLRLGQTFNIYSSPSYKPKHHWI